MTCDSRSQVKSAAVSLFADQLKTYLPTTTQSAKLSTMDQSNIRPTGNATILPAEDEAPLQGLVAESLKRLGYTVLQAA